MWLIQWHNGQYYSDQEIEPLFTASSEQVAKDHAREMNDRHKAWLKAYNPEEDVCYQCGTPEEQAFKEVLPSDMCENFRHWHWDHESGSFGVCEIAYLG